jgi:hypothetical protein
MYGVMQGRKDLHYGAIISLTPGQYTVRVRVNNARVSLPISIH